VPERRGGLHPDQDLVQQQLVLLERGGDDGLLDVRVTAERTSLSVEG